MAVRVRERLGRGAPDQLAIVIVLVVHFLTFFSDFLRNNLKTEDANVIGLGDERLGLVGPRGTLDVIVPALFLIGTRRLLRPGRAHWPPAPWTGATAGRGGGDDLSVHY